MRFEIRALADTQTLSRVMEPFALRLLLPEYVEMRREGDSMIVMVEMRELDEATAHLIVEKLAASVLVEEAVLSGLSARSLQKVAS